MSQQSGKKEEPVTISADVLASADRCHRKHSCQDPDSRKCCKVVDCVGNGVVFVQSENGPCPYKVSFGFSHKLCSCPVRCELHRKLQV